MLGDYLYYIGFRIKEWFSERGRKEAASRRECKKRRRSKYVFQKTAVFIAAVLWLITAVNVLWGEKNVSGQNRIISAFSNNAYSDMTSSVTAYGKYGTVNLTDNAKRLILEKIANEIGINKYEVADTTEGESSVKTLSQSSVNGDVICKFITKQTNESGVSSEQYLYIGITLKNSIDSTFTYEDKVKEIMKGLEISSNVTVNLKGEISGKLNTNAKDALSNQLLSKINAKVVAENRTDEVYTIYAFDKEIKEYLMVGNDKVNVNVSIAYDETRDVTNLYFSTPINSEDY